MLLQITGMEFSNHSGRFFSQFEALRTKYIALLNAVVRFIGRLVYIFS
jgi:hypothetical protein